MQLKINENAPKQLKIKPYPDILSVHQVQEILGIGRVSVYHLIENDRLPAFRKGRVYYIPKHGLKQFLSNNDIGGARHDW